MAAIKSLFLVLYRGMLALYPADFRQAFAEDMSLDFEDALRTTAGAGSGTLLSVFLREVVDWPVCLLREYRQLWGGRREMTTDNLNRLEANGGVVAAGRPGGTWGEAVMAALPYLLILAFMSMGYLLNTLLQNVSLRQGLNTFSVLLLVPILILVLVLSFRSRWPVWTGSWMVPFFLLLGIPLSFLANNLFPRANWFSNDVIPFVVLPLLLAIVLYRVARRDRLQGLLAAAPALYLLWTPNTEFVPEYLKLIFYFSSILMVMAGVMAVVRLGSWRAGLGLLLVTFIAVGLQFSYLGIYHGGTLPFSAPGPSLLEVFKSFLPQYLLAGAILVGPLLARNFREIGLRCGSEGEVSYRLALSGLLALMGINLVSLLGVFTNTLPSSLRFFTILDVLALVCLALYMCGVIWLYWAAAARKKLPDLISCVLLAFLPPLLPTMFAIPFFGSPRIPSRIIGIPFLYGQPEWLVFGIGLAWLLACVWLILRMGDMALPSRRRSTA